MQSPNQPESASTPGRKPGAEAFRTGQRRCIACGVEPGEGQTLTAVLIELPRSGNAAEEYQRLDYCAACWPASPWSGNEQLLDEGQAASPVDAYGAEPVAQWTARLTASKKPRRTFVDDSVLMNFFLRLAETDEPVRQRFRFVLMLILMRRRKLRHDGSDRDGDGHAWRVRLTPAMAEATGSDPEQVHRVLDPEMDDQQIAEVAEQLGQILQEDLDEQTEGGTS